MSALLCADWHCDAAHIFASQPFPCVACGESLSLIANPAKWFVSADFRNELSRLLAPIAQWIKDLETRYSTIALLSPALSKIGLLDNDLGNSDHAVVGHIASKLIPIPVEIGCLQKMQRPLTFQTITVIGRNARSEQESRVERASRLRYKIVKSIRRHLLRIMRTQSRYLARALVKLNSRQLRDGPNVNQTFDDCPVVVAFARWISNFNWQRTHSDLPFPESEGIYGINEMDTSETLWAFSALSDFYCCLITAITFQQYLFAKARGVSVVRDIFEQIISETAMPRVNWGCISIELIRTENRTEFLLVRADERCLEYVGRKSSLPVTKAQSTQGSDYKLLGLLPRRPSRWIKFSEQAKLQILRAADETSVSVAAKSYGIPKHTIYGWRHRRKYSVEGTPP